MNFWVQPVTFCLSDPFLIFVNPVWIFLIALAWWEPSIYSLPPSDWQQKEAGTIHSLRIGHNTKSGLDLCGWEFNLPVFKGCIC